MTLIRWEKAGILKPIRIGQSSRSMVFYREGDINRMIEERAS